MNTATQSGQPSTVERRFKIHDLAANAIREATAVAAALESTARSLSQQAKTTHDGACAPVLRMLGIPEGRITELDDTPDGPVITIVVPAPAQPIGPKLVKDDDAT